MQKVSSAENYTWNNVCIVSVAVVVVVFLCEISLIIL